MSDVQERINELTSYAEKYHSAVNSKPIREDDIIYILNNTTNRERQIMRQCYKKLYGHPIQDDMKDLSSKFHDLCLAMFDTQYEYDARELHRSLHSFMNDDNVICEIMTSRPKWMLDFIDQVYNKFYKISLREDLRKETSGIYQQYLLALMDNEREEGQTISIEEAEVIAKELNQKGPKNWGKDVDFYTSIFVKKSREDLILIARVYNELYKIDFYDCVNKNVSGTCRKLIKAILWSNITPAEYFAKKAFRAVEGLGTDTNTLNRAIIPRAEIDMDAIRDYYYMDRKVDIKDDVAGDTSGPYGKTLGALTQKK